MVEVIYYEAVDKNKTIGYADIRIPILKPTVIILRKVAHLNSEDKRWVSLPSFKREAAGGEPFYEKYFEFEDKSYNWKLLDTLRLKVDEYCKAQGVSEKKEVNIETEIPF